MQKEEFLHTKFAGIVVVRNSNNFYQPGGTKTFGQITLEIKINNSDKHFGMKGGAKKK